MALQQDAELTGYDALKRDIIRGVFLPDEKLRMSQLTLRYRLGVGPLREALSRLIAENLVTAISQKGYRVASMSQSELLDIYDARASMEAMLITLAMERGGDDWEAAILAQAHRLRKLTARPPDDALMAEWDRRHRACHTAIVAGCGSDCLLQTRDRLFDLAARYRYVWLKQTVWSASEMQAKHQQHQQLVSLILARETQQASRAMRDHLLTPIPIISRVLWQHRR